MYLKRIYNHEAPEEEWAWREEKCETCRAKGVVVNEAGDGIEACPDCEEGVRRTHIPPVLGVRILRIGREQKLWPQIIAVGYREGWLERQGNTFVIHDLDRGEIVLTIKRSPEVDKELEPTLHSPHYECEVDTVIREGVGND